MSPTVRPATGADALEVAGLYFASRRDALPYLRQVHSDDEVRDWIAQVLIPRDNCWLAERDGLLLGLLSVVGEEVDQLYLRPGFYRQGIGTLLLEKAKMLSPRRLALFCFQRNERARAFYEAAGFIAARFGDGVDNEEREPDIRYEWTG